MTQETITEKVQRRKAALEAANRERAVLQALDIIMSTCTAQPAPRRIDLFDPTYKIVTVGIGKDTVATILVTDDDIKALNHLLGKES